LPLPLGPLLHVAQPVQVLAQLAPYMLGEVQLIQAPVAEGDPPMQAPQLGAQTEAQLGP
jgi:hypothetical protein